jgi:hypothetical protein
MKFDHFLLMYDRFEVNTLLSDAVRFVTNRKIMDSIPDGVVAIFD